MFRVTSGLTAFALVASGIGVAQAADWGVGQDPVFKPAYPMNYAQPDPLGFEAGLRYFYGMGSQSFGFGGSNYSADDTSHALEIHGRIDDYSTSTYLKGHIGYGAIVDGTYAVDGVQNGTYQTGRIAYGTIDFGYMPVDGGTARFGFFGGYQYANESPQGTGLDIHGLRLGLVGRAELSNTIDFNAEVAAIPYALVSGRMDNPGQSLTGISGSLWGGSAEAMVGFHPTDNFTIRGGVRGTYLNGHVTSNQPGDHPVEMFRWGPVVELTASF